MPYTPHALAQFGGRINTAIGNEIWSCTLRVQHLVDSAIDGGELGTLAPALLAWWTSAASKTSSNAMLDYLKLNNINAAGHYENPGVTHEHLYPNSPTGSANPTLPLFCSVAWSWTTSMARGPASKGRIYPPNNTSVAPGGQGILTAAEAGGHLQGALALIAAFSDSNLVPGVYSNINGAHHNITGARVGNIVDVQRRRKNAFHEAYVGAQLPADEQVPDA